MSDYVKKFATDVDNVITVYDSAAEPPYRGAWRHRVKAWVDSEPTEEVIQQAIEEWATIAGGPGRSPNDTTLAHYIAAKLFAPESVDAEHGGEG